jgi:hypothetical protein
MRLLLLYRIVFLREAASVKIWMSVSYQCDTGTERLHSQRVYKFVFKLPSQLTRIAHGFAFCRSRQDIFCRIVHFSPAKFLILTRRLGRIRFKRQNVMASNFCIIDVVVTDDKTSGSALHRGATMQQRAERLANATRFIVIVITIS